ncbi:ParA family protein [Methylobacterium organophilum]|uniref:Iron-sulfur cluster carrier protein n=1 Tax=Methylobacterium organophilum TaxID=410 RepID=A0ABQ4T526_METOR|nr:AAA family ATPase [Methylobacterium organophilum]GJE25639.1 Iron-sulfur cluster carrier protein [Methylobacterium organophilum]
MAKFISIFNNKGGVGKTTLTWNIADTLAEKGKRVLLVDFDPQCNLSIAMLGSEAFKNLVSVTASTKTIRSFLQGYLQNTGPGPITAHTGPHTNSNVKLIAGDFWLNVYSDALSVGNDLLTGNGIAKFTALRTLESKLSEKGEKFDYVMIDLPPSFGGLVRSSLYSSDYLLIPCTSDTFSEYCIGLISQMLPQFISDWNNGLSRFRQNNYGSKEYDKFGKLKYAGWIFNGYDTRSEKMLRADQAHYEHIKAANERLAKDLTENIKEYNPVLKTDNNDLNMGKVEDMNVLIQNSLWLNVPASKLDQHLQVKNLSGDKQKWSEAQITLIKKIRKQTNSLAVNIINNL